MSVEIDNHSYRDFGKVSVSRGEIGIITFKFVTHLVDTVWKHTPAANRSVIRSALADELEITPEKVTEGELLRLISESMKGVAEDDELLNVRKGSDGLELLAQQSENPHLQLQSYIIRTLVDDIWRNIGMKSSIYIHDKVINSILQDLGEELEEISDIYLKGEYEEAYEHLGSMYVTYHEWIEKINKSGDENPEEVINNE